MNFVRGQSSSRDIEFQGRLYSATGIVYSEVNTISMVEDDGLGVLSTILGVDSINDRRVFGLARCKSIVEIPRLKTHHFVMGTYYLVKIMFPNKIGHKGLAEILFHARNCTKTLNLRNPCIQNRPVKPFRLVGKVIPEGVSVGLLPDGVQFVEQWSDGIPIRWATSFDMEPPLFYKIHCGGQTGVFHRFMVVLTRNPQCFFIKL